MSKDQYQSNEDILNKGKLLNSYREYNDKYNKVLIDSTSKLIVDEVDELLSHLYQIELIVVSILLSN